MTAQATKISLISSKPRGEARRGNVSDTNKFIDEELRQPEHIKAWAEPDEHHVLTACQHLAKFGTGKRHLDDDFYDYRMSVYSIIFNLMPGKRGIEWLHDRVKDLKNYDKEKFQDELTLALVATPGPYTCDEMLLHSELVCEPCLSSAASSPITLKPYDYIETEKTGFWLVTYTNNGEIKSRKPCYEDLYKKWQQTHRHVTLTDTAIVYTFNGSYWTLKEKLEIKGFVQDKMDPKPSDSQRREFLSLIEVSNRKPGDWLQESTEGYINLSNGVFNIRKDEIVPHSSDFGFRYELPYSYDKDADCPLFRNFLDDVTLGLKDMQQVIVEFMGYALANGPCFAEKAMILYGGGANGKSTFMDVLKGLAGKDNYASLSLTALAKDTKRYMVDGKLFNIGEETNVRALGDSEVFKTMVTGGEIDVKKLFVQDYTIKNRCKLIMACNELPKSSDRSDGLYRRMLLIPFNAKFTEQNKDPQIREKLLKELPGIFNLAIEGYKRLVANNYNFTRAESLEKAMSEYKLENDNIRLWEHNNLEYTGNDDDYIFKHKVYEHYKRECEEDGAYAVNKMTFFRELKNKFGELNEGKRYDPICGRVRAIHGFRMKGENL